MKKIGFYAAVSSALFYILFDLFCVLGLTGVISSKFWITITWYTPSIFLALSFVILTIIIHHTTPAPLQYLSHIGISLGIIYATLNCFTYIIQVLTIAPAIADYESERVALFTMAPGQPLYAVNALAYTLMGLSTLFIAFTFKGKGLPKAIKTILLIHGATAPFIIGAFLYSPLFVVSATVGITYPVGALLLARYFKGQ